jgi:hypothetical protein
VKKTAEDQIVQDLRDIQSLMLKVINRTDRVEESGSLKGMVQRVGHFLDRRVKPLSTPTDFRIEPEYDYRERQVPRGDR